MTTKMLIVEKGQSGFNDKVELLSFEKDADIRPTIVAAMKNRSDLAYVLVRYDGEHFVCRPIKMDGTFTGTYNKSKVQYHPLANRLED